MKSELIIGQSRLFKKALEDLDKFAKSPWPVLITGETGVGKELLAQRVHFFSLRNKGPFIPVNCGALPPGLFESELFGYERGAFSGAVQSHRGLVRTAQGGSLFLDEIGELDLTLQVKLLRLLESQEIRSVGACRVETVDVRIIAATNRNLEELVREGRFRHDLLERLSVLPVHVPPLRERSEDIPVLAQEILERMGAVTEGTDLSCLSTFDWPGNARQLKNFLIRAYVLGGTHLGHDFLSRLLAKERGKLLGPALAEPSLTGVTLADIERQVVIDRLKRCHGNRKRAAKELGIAKSTLHEKLRKWKLDTPEEAWPLYREPQYPAIAP
ncbi:MAG: sigma-54-dependent Fis family transcriptional regulator [Proteobacteria bacterium]|nr:sigma-54-dependent Fis family transcriptional regulator [Pseudomonadota bacterium]